MRKMILLPLTSILFSCAAHKVSDEIIISSERQLASSPVQDGEQLDVLVLTQEADRYNLKLNAEDAVAVKSVFEKSAPKNDFSFQAISCVKEDKCTVQMRSERYAKFIGQERDQEYHTNYGINLNNTLDTWLTEESDRMLYAPVQSWFLHGGLADFVTFSGKVYDLMEKSNSKYVIKSRSAKADAEVLTLQSDNINWSCWKYDNPKTFKNVEASIPHGPILLSRSVSETHGCRFFTKLNLKKKSTPTMIVKANSNVNLEYSVLRPNGVQEPLTGLSIGVDFMRFVDTKFNPKYRENVVIGATDDKGQFKFDKEIKYYFEEVGMGLDLSSIGFGVSREDLTKSLIAAYNLPEKCKEPLYRFISVKSIDKSGSLGNSGEGQIWLSGTRTKSADGTVVFTLDQSYYTGKLMITGGWNSQTKDVNPFDDSIQKYVASCK